MSSPHPVLTDLAFNILLAASEEPLHGYALIRLLRGQQGREKLRTGTVYAAVARLQKDGLLTEVSPPDGTKRDERRRYYQITEAGREVARNEASRLAAVLSRARDAQMLRDAARG